MAMELVLTDNQRLLIIIAAFLLFILSVIITCCVVSPICFLNRLLLRARNSKKSTNLNGCKQRLVIGESKHFQLKVVPLYGTSNSVNKNCSSDELSPTSEGKLSCLKSITKCAKQVGPKSPTSEDNACLTFPCVWVSVKCEKSQPNCDQFYKLLIKVEKVTNLSMRDYGIEPACYIIVEVAKIAGLRTKRYKPSSTKQLASFKTDTARRSLSPIFKQSFTTESITRSVLKEAKITIKLMDDERYANDYCIAELVLPVKQFLQGSGDDLDNLSQPSSSTCYQTKPPKEFKGMIHVGACFLPTAKRITIHPSKANLTSHAHGSNYYVRVLMFSNGKLIKKKKTTSSERLQWSESDALNFDLEIVNLENSAFLLVLSSTNDPHQANMSSPSSPESPEIPPSGSRKDNHIGHAVIGNEMWKEVRHNPRKKIFRSFRLL